MKTIIIAAALGMISFVCMAQTELLTGKFGHQYTEPKNTPVWEIKKINDQYQLSIWGATETSQPSHELSEQERRKFWQKMWWPEDSSVSASCVMNSEEMICYVSPKARNEIDYIKGYKSNYFHYDRMGGVMETHKIDE